NDRGRDGARPPRPRQAGQASAHCVLPGRRWWQDRPGRPRAAASVSSATTTTKVSFLPPTCCTRKAELLLRAPLRWTGGQAVPPGSVAMTETCGHDALPRDCGDSSGNTWPIGIGVIGHCAAVLAVLLPTASRSLMARRWFIRPVVAGSRRYGCFRFVASIGTPCSGCRDIRSAEPSGRTDRWQVPRCRSLTCTHDSLTS